MGRNIKPRMHYYSDAGYLIRLKKAIEQDGKVSGQFKREVLEHLNNLIVLFLDDYKKRQMNATS